MNLRAAGISSSTYVNQSSLASLARLNAFVEKSGLNAVQHVVLRNNGVAHLFRHPPFPPPQSICLVENHCLDWDKPESGAESLDVERFSGTQSQPPSRQAQRRATRESI